MERGEETMNIKEKLLPIDEYSRSGGKLLGVKGVVVHYVGVAGQKPEQTIAYFESLRGGKNGWASAHYVVGNDGTIYNCIPKDEVAWHCGATKYREGIEELLGKYPNNTTIGIEMCHEKDGFTDKCEGAASWLCAMLLRENGLTINDLYRHYDVTGKLCPLFYAESEYEWACFKALVKGKM